MPDQWTVVIDRRDNVPRVTKGKKGAKDIVSPPPHSCEVCSDDGLLELRRGGMAACRWCRQGELMARRGGLRFYDVEEIADWTPRYWAQRRESGEWLEPPPYQLYPPEPDWTDVQLTMMWLERGYERRADGLMYPLKGDEPASLQAPEYELRGGRRGRFILPPLPDGSRPAEPRTAAWFTKPVLRDMNKEIA